MGLLEFLKDWLGWAQANSDLFDSEETDPSEAGINYSPQEGLCLAVHEYTRWVDNVDGELRHVDLGAALSKDFIGNESYPFGGRPLYNSEANSGTIHINEDRLAWVRKKIKELENGDD